MLREDKIVKCSIVYRVYPTIIFIFMIISVLPLHINIVVHNMFLRDFGLV